MTKIKNFRIALHVREVARLLKARQNGIPLDASQGASLEPTVAQCRPLLAPASIYATMTRQTAVNAVPFELPKKSVALSAICVTIGPELLALREKAQAQGHNARADVLACVEQEALRQAMAFALRLVVDQAKKEDCLLTDPQDCQESETRKKLATMLTLERIGLALSESDAQLPLYARLVYAVWLPAVRASSAKRAPSKPRAEKAAL